jgi:hypothetical protein
MLWINIELLTVIIPFGWLYNFLVIMVISSVIIILYLAVSFLSGFVQFSVIILGNYGSNHNYFNWLGEYFVWG